MNILLDAHVLLWWLNDSAELPEETRAVIANKNIVFISAATIWELSIKASLGKLKLPGDINIAIEKSCFEELNISFAHAELAGKLPHHHRDPFDRMLIAQAKIEKLTIVTHDKKFKLYKTPLILT